MIGKLWKIEKEVKIFHNLSINKKNILWMGAVNERRNLWFFRKIKLDEKLIVKHNNLQIFEKDLYIQMLKSNFKLLYLNI